MGTIQIAFLIACAVVGGVEWLKGLLPDKVKDNKKVMTLISGALSVVAGVLYVIYAHITPIVTAAIFVGIVLCFTQGTYSLCFKTFKAIQEKLKSKALDAVDPDKIAETVTDTVIDSAEKLLTEGK